MISPERRTEFGEQLRERRGRGRPVSDKIPVKPTSVKIPNPVHDALCSIARRERVSLHRILNQALTQFAATNFR
jgi:hypothetical protein